MFTPTYKFITQVKNIRYYSNDLTKTNYKGAEFTFIDESWHREREFHRASYFHFQLLWHELQLIWWQYCQSWWVLKRRISSVRYFHYSTPDGVLGGCNAFLVDGSYRSVDSWPYVISTTTGSLEEVFDGNMKNKWIKPCNCGWQYLLENCFSK